MSSIPRPIHPCINRSIDSQTNQEGQEHGHGQQGVRGQLNLPPPTPNRPALLLLLPPFPLSALLPVQIHHVVLVLFVIVIAAGGAGGGAAATIPIPIGIGIGIDINPRSGMG